MYTTKNAIHPCKGWSLNPHKPKICLPRKCHQNPYSNRNLSLPPNNKNTQLSSTTMANNAHVYALTHRRHKVYTNNPTKYNATNNNTPKPHIYILCGDFNRDITLIGRQNELNTTLPQTEDIEWRTFTNNLPTHIHSYEQPILQTRGPKLQPNKLN